MKQNVGWLYIPMYYFQVIELFETFDYIFKDNHCFNFG